MYYFWNKNVKIWPIFEVIMFKYSENPPKKEQNKVIVLFCGGNKCSKHYPEASGLLPRSRGDVP